MRTVLISEHQLRQAISKLLVEAKEKTAIRGIFENLMLLAEKYSLEYDPYWLAASALALVEGRDDSFLDYIIYSIKAGGISYVAKNYNGQSWNVKVTQDQKAEIEKQIKRRIALIEEIRPNLSSTFNDESRKFMLGTSSLTALGEKEKKQIEEILQDPGLIDRIVAGSGTFTRKTLGVTLAYDDAREALTRGDYTRFLGKAVLVRPPKTYEEMSEQEKQKFEEFLGGDEKDIKLFRAWSKPPEAEIIGVRIEKGSAPLGLAYVYPTVTDSLDTLREKNLQSFEWNKKNFSLIDVASPVAALAAAKFSDVFDKSEFDTRIKSDWRVSSRIDEDEISSLRSLLSESEYLEDGTRLSTTGMAIIDLRTTLQPNKVYTAAGRKAAAKFECVADSTLEKIELAFADMNPDINMACKLAMADSLKIGLSVAGAQIVQSTLPTILTAVGAAVGGPPGAAIGQLTGRVSNAVLVVFENGITQLVPLAYGMVYFSRKGETEASGWCLARLIVSLIQTILQVLTPEIAALLPAGSAKDFILRGISRELFINIGSLFIDLVASIEQAEAINPGQKAEILSALSKIIPVWDKELTPADFKKIETSVAVNLLKDLQGVNGLFDAFNNLRYSEQNKD